jgi:tetratricopeptide (TPR) repeat protein
LGDARVKAGVFLAFAEALFECGAAAQAEIMLEQARAVIETIGDLSKRFDAVYWQARIYAKAGRFEQASRAFSQMREMAGSLQDGEQKKRAREQMGWIQEILPPADDPGNAGAEPSLSPEVAEQYQRRVAEALQSPNELKAFNLTRIARELAQTGAKDQAMRTLAPALPLLGWLADEGKQAASLAAAALTLAICGEAEEAAGLASKALVLGVRGDPAWYTWEYSTWAVQALARAGQAEAALHAWRDWWAARPLDRRSETLSNLIDSAPVLAALDGGQTLLRVYEALQEVDGWWDL